MLLQLGTRFEPNKPHAAKTSLPHPLELIGDIGHVQSCLGPFRASVNHGANLGHGFPSNAIGPKIIFVTLVSTRR